jgi:sugar phosphate isomerase/epimerase
VSRPELGVCLAAFADLPFDEVVAVAAKNAVAVVDLPTDSIFRMSRDRPSPDAVRRRFEDEGIRVACVSNSRDAQLLLGPHGPHTDGVATGSAAAKARHGRNAARSAIELAHAVGAPFVRLMLGCPDFARWLSWTASDVSWHDNVEAFVEAAEPLAREAEAAGVRLCVEPHVKQVPFDAPSWLECEAGMRSAGVELGLCFDAANVAALGFDPVEFLAETGSVPACVHVKDVERSSSAMRPSGPGWARYGPHPAIRFRAVPWGEVDWPAVLGQLAEVGFTGPVLVEHEDLLLAPEAGVAGALRFLDEVISADRPGRRWW